MPLTLLRSGRIPTPMTSFVGRSNEVTSVTALLHESRARWLTLTGPPGVGKTRIAMAIAARLAQSGESTVRWVDLTPLTDAALVIDAVAAAAGLQESATGMSQTIDVRLADWLGPTPWVMFLDNLEHVVDAARLVTDIQRMAPGLRIIATSREPARVEGEHRFPINPLPIDHLSAPAHEGASAAVTLFLDRARAIDPNLSIPTGDTAPIIEICQRLDGLPLAIELAAASLENMSLADLRDGLERQLSLPVAGPSGVPARQRTLDAAYAWSEHLLSYSEWRLFHRLGIVPGAFDTGLATAVFDDPVGNENVRDVLRSLERKSLIHPSANAQAPTWTMLHTARKYASDRLNDTGERESTRASLAKWIVQSTGELAGALLTARQDAVFDVLERRRPAIQETFRILRDSNRWAEFADLAGALRGFWYGRALYLEGRGFIETALGSGDLAPVARGRLLQGRAMLNLAQQQAAPALEDFVAAEDLLTSSKAAPWEIAIGRLGASTAAFQSKLVDDARSFLMGALAVVADHDPEFHEAMSIAANANFARARAFQGDIDGARGLFADVRTRQAATGVTWYTAISTLQEGTVEAAAGEHQRALACYHESLELSFRHARDLRLAADAVMAAATSASQLGNAGAAARLLGAEQSLLKRIGGQIAYITGTPEVLAATRSAVRAALTRAVFDECFTDGEALNSDELLDVMRRAAFLSTPPPRPAASRRATPKHPYGLTAREHQLLPYLGTGLTAAGIAYALPAGRTGKRVKPDTVEKHLSSIYTKLGVRSRSEAAVFVMKHGLDRPDEPSKES